MPDAIYSPLRRYVSEVGGMKANLHPRLRDQLVDWAVEEFPIHASDDRGAQVLAARLRIRLRKHGQYESLLAVALVSILANLIAKLVWEWWNKRQSHRVLMVGWQRAAQNRDV